MRMGNISKVRWGVSILNWKCNSSGNCRWSYRKCTNLEELPELFEEERTRKDWNRETWEERRIGMESWVVIRNKKEYFKNVKMSKEKGNQNVPGWIIKVFKVIKEALSKMVSNIEKWMRKEELEKRENHTKNRLRW